MFASWFLDETYEKRSFKEPKLNSSYYHINKTIVDEIFCLHPRLIMMIDSK